MSIQILYLLFVVLPNLRYMASGPVWILIIIGLMCGGMALLGEALDENMPSIAKEIGARIRKWCLISGCILGLLFIFTPSKDQIYLIAGGYAVTNDAELKKLPDNVLRAANTYLEKINKIIDEKDSKK